MDSQRRRHGSAVKLRQPAVPSGPSRSLGRSMPRAASVYVCSDCGQESARWSGQCPGCGEWNTLVEESRAPELEGGRRGRSRAARRAAAGAAGAARAAGAPGAAGASAAAGAAGAAGASGSATRGAAVAPVALGAIAAEEQRRLSTGVGELDAVLGGGLVPGSLVLIGGAPGIGKSTLTTMALANLVAAGHRTLYVSAEESAAQIRLRAERLTEAAALRIPVIAETDLDAVCATLELERPEVCVIDSVQTLYAAELSGAPGSVGQVREVTGAIMEVAKALGIAVLLVGHVTKEGSLAGPRVLEHLVDCVLQFEGERERTYRTVRAVKNRFGSTNEVAVFEMRDDGLVEVLDASARFVAEATRAPGSVVLCSMEGSRPLLVEVQALVARSELVPPRRVVSGLDRNRVALVLAVLGRHAGIGLGASDVFVNVVGGVRVDEPGVDLAVALAVASAARGVCLSGSGDAPLACFGELGLTGELRTVAHPDRRLGEAAKFGLGSVVEPATCPTLRAALAAALGRAPAVVAA
jgi:DNA repair protein RadA/Sms